MPLYLFSNHIIPTSNQHKTKLFRTTSTGSEVYYPYSFELSIDGIAKAQEANQLIQLSHKAEDPRLHCAIPQK